MKRFAAVVVSLLVLLPLAFAQGGALKCKAEGLYVCCKDCEKSVQDSLGKVAGVSEVACHLATKTVTFKARNQKAADDAVSALIDGGFYFKITVGDETYDVSGPAPKITGETLVIRNVHVCCDGCEKTIEGLFKDAKVAFAGKGPVKDVTLTGKNFDSEQVLEVLHGAGFHGVVVEKKR